MKYIICILSIIICINICYGGTIDPNKKDDLYLRIASKYDCCYRIHAVSKSNGVSQSTGSCVLIRPNLVMTAAHIPELHKKCNFCIYDNGRKINITKIYVPKKFDLKKISLNDLAICELSSQASSKPCEISFIKPRANTQVTIAGYGMIGNFNTGALKLNDDRLRAGFNKIDGYNNHCIITSAKLGSILTSAEYLIVGGDSGGGVFLNGKLIAINSYISAKKGSARGYWNNEAGHTSLYYMRGWINTILD